MIQKEEEASSAPIKIVVCQSSLAELEYQANVGRETGFAGLQELKRLSDMAKAQRIILEFTGSRPNAFEIEHARFGEIDSKIRDTARQISGTLLTTDKVQREVAAAEGIPVIYLEPIVTIPKLSLQRYFSSSGTMSVHLKEGVKPKAKIGKPGEFLLQDIGEKPLLRKEIEFLVREALEYAKRMPNSFVEIEKEGAAKLVEMLAFSLLRGERGRCVAAHQCKAEAGRQPYENKSQACILTDYPGHALSTPSEQIARLRNPN